MRASERGRRLGQPAAPYSLRGARRERRARNLPAAPSLSSQASDEPTVFGHAARLFRTKRLGYQVRKIVPIRGERAQGIAISYCSEWWAVLGSNQWPLPCETEVGCLRINDMRAVPSIATDT